ncbi:MAG: tetratricopeptide repeat protein [Planctomycetaceae bacterium]|nr:tetratricopeptide repeat protein [Planctomycetaceae bacterium]
MWKRCVPMLLALCVWCVDDLPAQLRGGGGRLGGGRSPGGNLGGGANLGGGTKKPAGLGNNSGALTPSLGGGIGSNRGGGLGSNLGNNAGGRPGSGIGSNLGNNAGGRPGGGIGSNLGNNAGGRPGGGIGSNLGNNAGGRPGGIGSNLGNNAGGGLGSNLGNNPGGRPGGGIGSNLGNNAGGRPGGIGSNLGGRPGINPGGIGSNLGGRPGINPGGIGSNLGGRPGINPGGIGSNLGGRPGINPGGIGSNVGNNIGNNLGGRPGINPGAGVGNNLGNRPIINNGNQIGAINRPGVNLGNNTTINGRLPWFAARPSLGSNPNINLGNTPNIGSGNNSPTINNNFNGPVVSGRPWYGQPWNAPTYPNHYGWHHGHWDYWPPSAYSPAAAVTAGVAAGWLLATPDVVYVNPYSVPQEPSTTIIYDYSQPIPVTPIPTQEPAAAAGTATTDGAAPTPLPPVQDPKTLAAIELFDEARAAFKRNDYPTALTKVNDAIRGLPGDPVLHEFRGLVLFAQQKFPESAEVVYAVLAAGPGWDWDTLNALYDNVDTYSEQLRGLEAYCQAHAEEADSRFLLAYHYLTLGYVDEARTEFQTVAHLQPKDELSAQLVRLLTPPEVAASDETAPPETAPN